MSLCYYFTESENKISYTHCCESTGTRSGEYSTCVSTVALPELRYHRRNREVLVYSTIFKKGGQWL